MDELTHLRFEWVNYCTRSQICQIIKEVVVQNIILEGEAVTKIYITYHMVIIYTGICSKRKKEKNCQIN
jgi:hypothetical protein